MMGVGLPSIWYDLPMSQPEAKLVTKLEKLIRQQHYSCFKIHGGDNPFQAVGIPDLLCCIGGLFVGIEAKLPGEKLRPAQVVALREIYMAGGVAAVVETAGQGARLLSEAEGKVAREGGYDPTHGVHGLVFDRGRWHRRFALK